MGLEELVRASWEIPEKEKGENLEQGIERFKELHSIKGKYVWHSALTSLLEMLSPDLKALMLLSLQPDKLYTGGKELLEDLSLFLEKHGLLHIELPSYTALWRYITTQRSDIIPHTSMIKGGILEPVFIEEYPRLRLAYRISYAGENLAKPLIRRAIEFVYRVKSTKLREGTHPSMWSIFSYSKSNLPFYKKKAFITYLIIKILSETSSTGEGLALDVPTIVNKMNITIEEINKEWGLEGYYRYPYEIILQSIKRLRDVGIVTYDSTYTQGVKYGDNIIYEIQRPFLQEDKDEFDKLLAAHEEDTKNIIYKLADLLTQYYQKGERQTNYRDIIKLLGGSFLPERHIYQKIREGLFYLQKYGYIRRTTFILGFSEVELTPVGILLWELLLKPAEETARTLKSMSYPVINKQKLETFINTYYEEKPRGHTEELTDTIITILKQPRKFSEIYEIIKEQGLPIHKKTLEKRLRQLVEEGEIKKIKEQPRGTFYMSQSA